MPNFRAQLQGSPHEGPDQSDIEMLSMLSDISPTKELIEAFRFAAAEATAERRCAKQALNSLRMVWLRFAQTRNPNAEMPF